MKTRVKKVTKSHPKRPSYACIFSLIHKNYKSHKVTGKRSPTAILNSKQLIKSLKVTGKTTLYVWFFNLILSKIPKVTKSQKKACTIYY